MSLFILATLAAFFVKGLCGFANTLVFQSILSFGVSNASISPVELVVGFPSNAILTWQNRKSLQPKIFLPLMALMLAGNIPGALMLSHIDGRIVVSRKIDDRNIKKLVLVLLIVSGAVLILQNI